MTGKRKVLTGVLLLTLVAGAAGVAFERGRDRGTQVRLEEVGRRDLVAIVTASGNIRARRKVDISSDVAARVAQLAVGEGEDVVQGQVLLRLDPVQFDAAVARAEAALSQAEAQAANQRANLLRAQREYDRVLALQARDSVLVSHQQIDDARTNLDVATANLEAAGFGVQQARASLDEARDRLSKTVIRSPISGRVTRLNIEEGETVVIGTMNNPGSLLLTISDLSVVEVVVHVDETEVPNLTPGDSASVQIDAFPNVAFTGRVTEIGHSAVRPIGAPGAPGAAGPAGQQTAVDFEVVITLDDSPMPLRPDLSATAEIVTDTRDDVVAVPIIALTVREAPAAEDPDGKAEDGEHGTAPATGRRDGAPSEVEGVFVSRGGRVTFTPVVLGIAGQESFEAVSGLAVGDTVVAGPYQAIRGLRDGDLVRAESPAPADRRPGGR